MTRNPKLVLTRVFRINLLLQRPAYSALQYKHNLFRYPEHFLKFGKFLQTVNSNFMNSQLCKLVPVLQILNKMLSVQNIGTFAAQRISSQFKPGLVN